MESTHTVSGTNSNSNSNSNSTSNKAVLSPPWRTRDSIHELLHRRITLLNELNITDVLLPSPTGAVTSSAEDTNSNSAKQTAVLMDYYNKHGFVNNIRNVQYSNKFNVDKVLAELQNDNYDDDDDDDDNLLVVSDIVRQTFNIAAMSVVHGFINLNNEQNSSSYSPSNSNSNSNSDHTVESPIMLQVLGQLDHIKNQCFQTALNHDHIVTSIQSSLHTSSSKPSSSSTFHITTSATSKGTGTTRKRKLSITNHDNNDNIDLIHSSNIDNYVSHSQKQRKSKNDQQNQKVDETNNNDDHNNGDHDETTTTTPTPSATFSTIATPSKTNTESRLTMSRAILCAAASIVFKTLTPRYQYHNDSDVNNNDNNKKQELIDDINILDVPQNIHFHNNTQNDLINENNNNDNNNNHENMNNESNNTLSSSSSIPSSANSINMGAVTMSAEIFAKRTIEQTLTTVKKFKQRRKWNMDCAKHLLVQNELRFQVQPPPPQQQQQSSNTGILTKWLTWNDHSSQNSVHCITSDDDDLNHNEEEDENVMYHDTNRKKYKLRMQQYQSEQWTTKCLPWIQDIMTIGNGHVIIHDMQWKTRFNRVLDTLTSLANNTTSIEGTDKYNHHDSTYFRGRTKMTTSHEPNYGPHLIITTQSDYKRFMNALDPLNYNINPENEFYLRALGYNGTKQKRRHTRIYHFTPMNLSGQIDAPFNVIVTTYTNFIEDYQHFCQIPFQAVVLDDGMSWLGAAYYDPNGQLGKVFDKGMWNQSDSNAGMLAGFGNHNDWDFSIDTDTTANATSLETNESKSQNVLVGLTARYRIIIASSLHSKYRGVIHSAPVPGLLSFLFPQFTVAVREEWDRSRINNCDKSIAHMRKLLCRKIVVFDDDNQSQHLYSLALSSMTGKLSNKRSDDMNQSSSDSGSNDGKNMLNIETEAFISQGKIVTSRRFAASWFRPGSAIRYELGTASLAPIIDTIKAKTALGYKCEEIVTASSLTSNGISGAICGTAAFKSAVRCHRTFTTEQGLRQHIAALHAPPGTWLCRSCGIDCGTSLGRTQHERSCGSNDSVANITSSPNTKENSMGGILPTVGQTSKKKKSTAVTDGSHNDEGRDANGCICVPGFTGVWVNPKGKHFVKIDGKAVTLNTDINDQGSVENSVLLFDSVEEAAKKYDIVMKEKHGNKVKQMKLNFNDDGSRIVYDTTSSAAAGRNLEMLGGGASSVVPALSVINIKDLPKGVVPLLRAPSRSSANSKRYVYLYRGVCRQARKGHDRWQSQISFGGHNHYLGTFDSEWDAAAIYAWAHLILYGEEATKKAQEEGEQAVAAYEQEQKDIAAGKIPKPISPASKPKKAKPKTKNTTPTKRGRKPKKTVKDTTTVLVKDSLICLGDMKSIYPNMSKGFQGIKVTSQKDDETLIVDVSSRILASRNKESISTFCCLPVSKSIKTYPSGFAILIGLTPVDFGWKIQNFLPSVQSKVKVTDEETLTLALESEFDKYGMNSRFRTVVKSFPCTIGKASKHLEEAASTLGFYGTGLGGTIGSIDCNIGGMNTCSEISAIISYSQSRGSFQLTAYDSSDFVSMNGKIIKPSDGGVAIGNKSICSVGSRVFVFILAE